MTNIEIIILALSLAFCWQVSGWLQYLKPFNCLMCLTGWVALVIGVVVHQWYGLVFFPVGCFAGAMFEAIRNRYL